MNEPKRIKKTVRVRRGLRDILGRFVEVSLSDIEDEGYDCQGMTKADWENLQLAVEWLRQQSREPGGGP